MTTSSSIIYQTNFLTPPSEENYTPPPFVGPINRINRLHNYPRGGYTNDITAIAVFNDAYDGEYYDAYDGGWEVDLSSGGPIPINGNIIGRVEGGGGGGDLMDTLLPTTTTNSTNNSTIQTYSNLEAIPPNQLSGITYDKQDAQDYIKGIATVAILVLLLYIIWGVCLIALRVGRMDFCCRLWCCRLGKVKNSEGGGGEVDLSSTRALHNENHNNSANNNNEEHDSNINQDCCCITTRQSLIAKGGCFTRHVFCGWLAGKSITMPTKDSLRREEELKSMRLVKGGVKALGESVNVVKGVVAGAGGEKKLKSGGVDGQDDEEDCVVGEAEVAVAAVDSDSEDKVDGNVANKSNDDGPQDKSITKQDTTNNDTIIITNTHLQKRQTSTLQTLLTIRILFLLSSLLLIIFSIKLCFDGYRGINDIIDSTSNGLGVIANHVEEVKVEVEEYIEINEEMGRRKDEWLSVTRAQIQDNGGFVDEEEKKPWCPLALVNDGKINVNLSLAKLLLKGSLFKLALVDKVNEVKDDDNDVVDSALGAVVGGGGGVGVNQRSVIANNLTTEQVQTTVINMDDAKEKVFTVVTFLDDLQNAEGDRIPGILGKVLGLKDLVGGGDADAAGGGANNRIKMLVVRLTELVQSLIVKATDIAAATAEEEEIILPNNNGQRALQLQQQASDDTAVDAAITKTIVEKDGISYTILSLADNFTGTNDLIINGYNVTKLFTTDVTVEIDVAALTESINEKLEDYSSYLLDIFKRLQPALETVHRQATDAQESLESIVPYFTVAVVFVAILIGLTCFFIIGTILAWMKKQHWLFRCTNDNIILPIFILVGLLVWVFTTVFLTLGVLMGDYCFVSPDVQMNQIFEQTLAQLSPIGYKFAYYYFNGCDSAARPLLMNVAYNALVNTRVGLDQFFELVATMGEGPIRKACGLDNNIIEGDPVNALNVLANVIRTHIGGAMSAVITVAELTLCREFYPLYEFLAHQIVCNDFINLIVPLYESLFIVSICSMLMVTLRVAWHELVEDEADVDGGQDNGKLEDDLGTDEAAQMDAGKAGNDELVADTEKEKEVTAAGEVEAEEED